METISTEGMLSSTFTRLVRVQTVLWNSVDAEVRREHGISLAQLMAMDAIASIAECRVQDVASALHITVGGASKVVDKVLAAGLVDRQPHPADRRSVAVTVTPLGSSLLSKAAGTTNTILASLMSAPLGKSGVADLDRLLGKLDPEPAPVLMEA